MNNCQQCSKYVKQCIKLIWGILIIINTETVDATRNSKQLCPNGWKYSNLRCYKIVVYSDHWLDRSWSSARYKCTQEGGDLVTYNSALEAYSLSTYLKASGIKPKNLYWIGLSDENSDGIYMWVDNSPVTYTNWYHGDEPKWLKNNEKNQQQRILSSGSGIWYEVTGHWNKRIGDCNEPSGFVCEQRANLAIYAKILQEPDQSHSNQYHKLMRERYLLRLGPRRRIYHPHINSISSTVPTILEEGDTNYRNNKQGQHIMQHAIDESINKHNEVREMLKQMKPNNSYGYMYSYETSTTKEATSQALLNLTDHNQKTNAHNSTSVNTTTETTLPNTATEKIRTNTVSETTTTSEIPKSSSSTYTSTTGDSENTTSNYDVHSTTDQTITDMQTSNVNRTQHLSSTTLPPDDKVYHRGYHVHPHGQINPNLPNSNYGLPWLPIQANSQSEVKQQGINGAWLASSALQPSYRFINVVEFCSAVGTGIHAHPLHCWQFVVCGEDYGGNREGFCYPGRSFNKLYSGCIENKTCIYGARLVNIKRSLPQS